MNELSISGTLQAFGHKYYGGQIWIPKEGDYFTIGRTVQRFLCQIVKVDKEANRIFTKYCDPTNPTNGESWELEGFTIKGFGIHRLHVPYWFFKHQDHFDFDLDAFLKGKTDG